jgi:1,4-dihydroxy-2-naphthoate octaprenyltransferase/chlorophyll synthase
MDRPLLVPAALGCLGLFWAYTLPPLKLNYRGGGELLEMIGVGVALPWINAYAQAGSVTPAGFLPLAAGFAAASLASALASGLSDERSDRRGGKRTATTVFGNRIVRRTAEASLLTGALVWGAYLLFCPIEVRAPLGVALFVMIGQWRQLRAQSRHATTDAFAAQKRYKAHLHRAIWRSATLLSLGMVAMTWWWEP